MEVSNNLWPPPAEVFFGVKEVILFGKMEDAI